MARVYGIKKRLSEHSVDEALAREIIGNGDLVNIITRMDKLLPPDTAYQILDSSACGTSAKELGKIKALTGKTLSERVAEISALEDFHSSWNVALSQDGTLTAGWALRGDEGYSCACSAVVKPGVTVRDLLKEGRHMPLTYCLCCAGHCRRHLAKLLGLRLKTRTVISSPISSGGQKPCTFLLEITV